MPFEPTQSKETDTISFDIKTQNEDAELLNFGYNTGVTSPQAL